MEQHRTVTATGGLCAKCGACTAACPVFQVTGREYHGGRGKLHLLARLDPHTASATYAEILSRCLLCGACEAVCPRGLKITDEIARARAQLSRRAGEHNFLRFLTRQALAHPGLAKGLGTLLRLAEKLPAESGLRLRLNLPAADAVTAKAPPTPGPVDPATPLLYFAGCFATHLQPEIALATASLCRKAGQPTPVAARGQGCCGLAAYAAGDLDTAKKLARRNLEAFAGSEAPILVSCASCLSHLTSYPALLADEPEWRDQAIAFAARLREFSTLLLAGLADQTTDRAPQPPASRQRVLYHDPCHLRFRLKITEAPRTLLGRFPQLQLVELPHGPQCCGHGGLFHLAHPTLSAEIRDRLLADFAATGAETVTTTCTGCLLQWQQGLAMTEHPNRVMHLALLLDTLLP